MKNHIAFKCAAVFLAALLLVSTIVSGFGILLLSNYDLYNRTWEEGHEEALSNTREGFAQALVFRFASMEIGGCSTPLIDDYYGNGALYTSFRWGRYAYTVRSKNDQEIIKLDREIPNAEHFEIPVENGRFVYLISERDVEETTAERIQSAEANTAVLEAETTAATAQVESTEVTVSAVTEETVEASEAAAPEKAEKTAAKEEAEEGKKEAPAEEKAEDGKKEAPAEKKADDGKKEAAAEKKADDGKKKAAAEEKDTEETAEAAADETAAEETAAVEETLPVLQQAPPAAYRANPYFTRDQYDAAFSYPYYNYESGTMKDATLCYANTSDYTVDLYLAPDAMYDYQMWNLLKVIAPLRGVLFAILGGSLLLFVGLMLYIFCAAGRKPGSEELEPVGFNQMPLDLYTLILCAGAVGCFWLGSAGTELFRNTQMIQMIVAGGACFLGCLLLVCYSMAWAAQIKLKQLYFLKNTLVVRLVNLIYQLGLYLYGKIVLLVKHLPETWQWMQKHWGGWLHRVLMLMPSMWQWLACTGFVLLILLVAAIVDSAVLMTVGFLFAIGLCIYGAYCFSLLLQGVKRMRSGELKTKVESEALLGSMKEFAEELNGLAGVAGVAADKQLKSERMKTELITNVSHDIKTPLTSIINYVDLMERPHSEQEQEEYMEVLSRQSQRLKKLIDDLMEMSKASTGNMQTEITEVNATEAVTQCLGEFSDKLDRADLHPVFRAGEEEIFMQADGRLVWRVMSNVLGNVVKYALPGTRVYVDLTELGDDVLISVKNVSREELNISSDELMERFVRGDASRNTEGSGLGLNIAKSLMELQHGQLELLVDGDLFKVTLIFPKR